MPPYLGGLVGENRKCRDVTKRLFMPLVRLIDALDGYGEVAEAQPPFLEHLRKVMAYVTQQQDWLWEPAEIAEAENCLFLAQSLIDHGQSVQASPWWIEEALSLGYELHGVLEDLVKKSNQTVFVTYPQLDRLVKYLRSLEQGGAQAERWPRLAGKTIPLLADLEHDLSIYRPALQNEEVEVLQEALARVSSWLENAAIPPAAAFEAEAQLLGRMGEWARSLQHPAGCLSPALIHDWKQQIADSPGMEALNAQYTQGLHPRLAQWWAENRSQLLVPNAIKTQLFPILDQVAARPKTFESLEQAIHFGNSLVKVLEIFEQASLELKASLETPLDLSIDILSLVYQERLPIRALHQIVEKFQAHQLTGVYEEVTAELEDFFQDLDRDRLLEALEQLHSLRPRQQRRHQSLKDQTFLELFSSADKAFGLDLEA